MNFKICEGALAIILTTLGIYDFKIEFRPGSRHLDADSISRRPCVDQECAHCERFEKRYSKETTPRLATRNIGLLSEESVKQGESQLREERKRNSEQKLDSNSTPDDSLCNVNTCLKQGPLQTQCFEKETESLSTGGVRPNTSPSPGGPKIVTEWSLPQTETDQSQGTIKSCEESHGCDSIRVSEETREKQLQPRPSAETQVSCKSRVCKTTLGGSLGVDESQDLFKLHCAEETDSDSSYYDCEEEIESFNDEGCQENQSKSAYVRNTEAVNIDCLTPQNIKNEQDRQPEIQMIKEWKRDGKRPDWSQVAQYPPELKAYWSAWESLILMDEILYKQKPINIGPQNKPRIVLPSVLRKKCFTLLHDTVTSAHLGSQKTLDKVKQRFYWYGCRKDVEYWCKTCDICLFVCCLTSNKVKR